MESNNLQCEIKSFSFFNLDKKDNTMKKTIKKKTQQSSKCSLSKKKTHNNIKIKNIYSENKPPKISKFNVTPNSKKNKISSAVKINNSFNKIKKYKSNNTNSIMEEPKKVYTINIQLDSNSKDEINKNKMNKNLNFKSNKLSNSQKITITNNNNDGNKTMNEKIKKKINFLITPKKKITKNVNSVSKERKKKKLLFLNISHNNNSKIEEYSNKKKKFSKSVMEKSNELFNCSHNYIRIYNNITNNINIYNNVNNNNNDINNNSKNKNRNNTEKNNENKKILAIDLDETLIHTSFQKIQNPDLIVKLDSNINKKNDNNNNNNENSNQKTVEAYIRIRPGVEAFLSQISKYYDIYVYSASSKNYLNTIIKNIDKNNIIKQCFCREDCIMYVEDYEEGFDKPNNKYKYIKDLKKINKELRNIVLIDNNTISFKLQEKNGIPIKSWFDDYDDLELYKLIPILKNLSGFYDVRVEISKFVQNKTFIWSKSINWLIENCLNSSYLNEINAVLLKEQQKNEFQIVNYNNINMNINKPKVINNINNILINLNENDSNFKNNNKYFTKKHSFYKKLTTDYNKKVKNNTFKHIKIFKKNSDIKNTEKIILLENTFKKNNKRNIEKIKRYSNSNYSQKIQKNLFKKEISNPNNLMNNELVHQYSICFSKNNFMDKMDSKQSKMSKKKKKDNDNKIFNKYFLPNQNRVIINYINNKK